MTAYMLIWAACIAQPVLSIYYAHRITEGLSLFYGEDEPTFSEYYAAQADWRNS